MFFEEQGSPGPTCPPGQIACSTMPSSDIDIVSRSKLHSVRPETALLDHAVVSETVVVVVIVIEKKRKTGDYDNDHDNDNDKNLIRRTVSGWILPINRTYRSANLGARDWVCRPRFLAEPRI
jgi:hypothetical protein